MSEYRIEKLKDDNFEALIPLMKNAFNETETIDFFKWKFLDNPSGKFLGYVALTNKDEIASYYGVIPESYLFYGKKRIIFQSCDTMTHSEHRRKGLFKRLASKCYEQLEKEGKLFVIAFTGKTATPGFYKLGWEKIFSMETLFYPRQFCFFLGRINPENISEISNLELIEDSLIKSNNFLNVHSSKEVPIVSWRLANPRKNYKIIACKNTQAYKSYVIYYENGRCISILDYFFESKLDKRNLLLYVKQKLWNSKKLAITVLSKENSQASKEFIKSGFVKNSFGLGPFSEKLPFMFFAEKGYMDKFKFPNLWNPTTFDHDAL